MSALFWIASALLIGGALVLATRPLWSRRDAAPPIAAHEVSVYKSQLEEIDRDLERGALSEAEAEGARREIARRLLAADAAMEQEAAFDPAPQREAKRALLAFFAPLALIALVIYVYLGAPARPGAPFASRDLVAERAAQLLSQAEAERRAAAAGALAPQAPEPEIAALIEKMEETVKKRPDDPQGAQLLARAYVRLQRPADAWPLFARAAELLGPRAQPQLFAQMGEAMMLAGGGYVSREAEAAFARAPRQTISRYMLGVAASQRGDNRRALAVWGPLYAEQRAAPFAPALLEQIKRAATAIGSDPELVAQRLGAPITADETAQAEPGPSQEQMQAAAEMSEAERAAMIEGMVTGLAERLKDEPKDLPGWLRLLRAYAVLGRREDGAEALKTARAAFAEDPGALERLAAAEQALNTGAP